MSCHPRSACTPEQVPPWDSVDYLLPMYFLGERSQQEGGTCRWVSQLRVTEGPGSNSSLAAEPPSSNHPAGARPGEKTRGSPAQSISNRGTSRTTGTSIGKGPNWDNEHLKVRTARTPPVDRPGPGSLEVDADMAGAVGRLDSGCGRTPTKTGTGHGHDDC